MPRTKERDDLGDANDPAGMLALSRRYFAALLVDGYSPRTVASWGSGLTKLANGYVKAAEVGKNASCHVFRHSAATAMLENGADVRFIQEMLGHAKLTSTQVYTRVSIAKLKAVHTATHPAALLTGKRSDKDDPEEGK